jgi:hypothetical protein
MHYQPLHFLAKPAWTRDIEAFCPGLYNTMNRVTHSFSEGVFHDVMIFISSIVI